MAPLTNIKNNYKSILEEIIDYLDNIFTDLHYRRDLVERFPDCYLSRLFKDYSDTCITVYVNNRRIDFAKELLKDKDNRIIDIAYHVGFTNLSYFHGMFKKQTGMTPQEYRKRNYSRNLEGTFQIE